MLMKNIYRILLPVISAAALIFAVIPASAEGPGKILKYSLLPKAEYLKDTSGNADISAIIRLGRSGAMLPVQKEYLSLGFSADAHWIRAEVPQEICGESGWFTELKDPWVSIIDYYIVHKESILYERHSGQARPLSERDIVNRSFIFKTEYPCYETVHIYLRLSSYSPVIIPELYLKKDVLLTGEIRNDSFLFGIFYGIMGILTVYHLLYFFISKETIYLYYILHVFTFTYMMSYLNGFSQVFLTPDSLYWNSRSVSIIAPWAMAVTIIFVYKYTSMGKHFPLFRYAVYFLTVSFLIISAGSSLEKEGLFRYLVIFSTVNILVPVVAFMALFSIMKKDRMGVYLGISWSIFLSGIVVNTLKYEGLIPPHFWTYIMIQAGPVLDMLLLATGIHDRSSKLKEEKILAERRLSEERESVSRDLHDAIGSEMIFFMNEIRELPENQRFIRIEKQKIINMLSRIRIQLGNIVYMMQQSRDFRLSDEIKSHIKRLQSINQFTIDAAVSDEDSAIDHLRTINIYKIFTEWMTNIIRHSRSDKVIIRYCIRKNNIILCIINNGIPFSWKGLPQGTGLAGISERTRLMNGKVRCMVRNNRSFFLLKIPV